MNLQNNKKRKIIGIVLLVGVAAAIASAVYFIMTKGRISTDDAYVTGNIFTVASKIPGTVKSVNVRDNQDVNSGDVLVEIDPIDYQLKLNEAKANLEIRKAAFEQATRDKVRAENLFKQKVYSEEKYENALTAYNMAKGQADAADAQLKIAQQNLEYTKLYAPSDGYITKKSVEAGDQIMPDEALMAVVELDNVWLVANYKETDVKNIRPGQKVKIKVDAYPGVVFNGKVDSIMSGTGAVFSLFPPENALGNYVKIVQRIPVKILFDNNDDARHKLRLGMSCSPTIFTQDE